MKFDWDEARMGTVELASKLNSNRPSFSEWITKDLSYPSSVS